MAFLLNAMYVDDDQMRAFLDSTYGIPSRLANFTRSEQIISGLRDVSWTWTPTGYATSSVSAKQVDGANYNFTTIARYFWAFGNGISYMDLKRTFTASEMVVPINPGQMQPPMLYAASGNEQYLGKGQLYTDTPVEISIHRFGDFKCEKPLD